MIKENTLKIPLVPYEEFNVIAASKGKWGCLVNATWKEMPVILQSFKKDLSTISITYVIFVRNTCSQRFRISHPSIAKILCFTELKGSKLLVQEVWAESFDTLETIVQEKQLSTDEWLILICNILEVKQLLILPVNSCRL